MRTADAESIQIGDVRVVADTSFQDVTEGLLIDDKVVTEPYVITAIGETKELTGAMTFPDGPVDDVEDLGGTVSLEPSDALQIDAVATPDQDEFAQPE